MDTKSRSSELKTPFLMSSIADKLSHSDRTFFTVTTHAHANPRINNAAQNYTMKCTTGLISAKVQTNTIKDFLHPSPGVSPRCAS